MLGIDRQQRRAAAAAPRPASRAGRNQRFLVGERRRCRPASIAAIVGSSPAQPTIAAIVQSAPIAAASTQRLRAGRCLDAGAGQRVSQRGKAAFVGRPPRSLALVRIAAAASSVDVAIGGQRQRPAKRSGSRSTRSSVELPTEPVAPRMVTRLHPISRYSSAAHDQQRGDRRDRHQPVEPVEHAAMAGQQVAAVLHAGAALEPAFEQIAALREHREQRRGKRQPHRQGHRRRASATPNSAASDHAADQPGPGLVRADRRRELGAADRPAGEIGADIGRPHQRQRPEGQDNAVMLIAGSAAAPAPAARHRRTPSAERRPLR